MLGIGTQTLAECDDHLGWCGNAHWQKPAHSESRSPSLEPTHISCPEQSLLYGQGTLPVMGSQATSQTQITWKTRQL